jgi:hypothetical protein
MVQPPNSIQDASTVSGQVFHSNGQLLVLWLHAPTQAVPEIAAQATGSSAPADGVTGVTGAEAFTKN